MPKFKILLKQASPRPWPREADENQIWITNTDKSYILRFTSKTSEELEADIEMSTRLANCAELLNRQNELVHKIRTGQRMSIDEWQELYTINDQIRKVLDGEDQ